MGRSSFCYIAGAISSATDPMRYCGEYQDYESGLIYLRARYYNPQLGRFINEDPIKDGLNWYVYCNNNPVNFVDPSGLIVTEWDIEHLSSNELEELNILTIEYQIANSTGDQIGMNVAHGKAVKLREPYLNQFEQVNPDGTVTESFSVADATLAIVLAPLMVLTGCTASDHNTWLSNNIAWKSGAYTVSAPSYLIIDNLQLGTKFGKHMLDYPGMTSYVEYRDLAYDVFNNADSVIYDKEHNEYYYTKGDNLLRVKPNGTFVSLYPGANSPRVNNVK